MYACASASSGVMPLHVNVPSTASEVKGVGAGVGRGVGRCVGVGVGCSVGRCVGLPGRGVGPGVGRSVGSIVGHGFVYLVTFVGEADNGGVTGTLSILRDAPCTPAATSDGPVSLAFESEEFTEGVAGAADEVWTLRTKTTSGRVGGDFELSVSFEGDMDTTITATASVAQGSADVVSTDGPV